MGRIRSGGTGGRGGSAMPLWLALAAISWGGAAGAVESGEPGSAPPVRSQPVRNQVEPPPAASSDPAQVLDRYRSLIEQETLSFTLDQAVEVATVLHPEVRRRQERLGEFPMLVREARAPYLPQLALDLQAAQTRDPGFRNSPFFSRLIEDPEASAGFGGGDPSSFGGAFTFGTYLWNFRLSQTLWSFRFRPAMRAVDLGRAIAENDLAEARNRVARDTVTRLYTYLLGLRTRDVLEQAVRTRERALEVARDRLELGAAARLEVLRARVELSRLRRELAAAEDTVTVERAGVNALVGREQDRAIEVLDELVLPDPVPRILPAAALAELAIQHRPSLRRFALDREVLEVERRLAAAESRPRIDGNASYGINTFTLGNTYDLELHNWNAGVSLTWNLFDGFQTSSRVASLRSQETQNEWEQNEFETTLEVLLRNAAADWNGALEAVSEAVLALEEAAEAERVAAEEVAAGAAMPFLQLEAAQTRREVELEHARHTTDALNALAELKFLVGFPASAPHAVISETPVRAADASDPEENR